MNRRRLLLGLVAAPAVIRIPGLLMPVRAYEPEGYVRVVPTFAAPRFNVMLHAAEGPALIAPVSFAPFRDGVIKSAETIEIVADRAMTITGFSISGPDGIALFHGPVSADLVAGQTFLALPEIGFKRYT